MMDNNHFNKEDKDNNLEEKQKDDNTNQDSVDKDDQNEAENKEEKSPKPEEPNKKKTPRERQIEILKHKIKEEEEKNFNRKPDNGGFGGINFRNIMLLVALLTIIFYIFNMKPSSNNSASNEIGYSEFVNKINNGEIVRVEEKSGYLTGYLTPAAITPENNQDGNAPSSAKDVNIGRTTTNKQGEITYKTRMITTRIGNDPNIMAVLNAKNVQLIEIGRASCRERV